VFLRIMVAALQEYLEFTSMVSAHYEATMITSFY
jgi:hypothetical protein